jgi:hypothetical protein
MRQAFKPAPLWSSVCTFDRRNRHTGTGNAETHSQCIKCGDTPIISEGDIRQQTGPGKGSDAIVSSGCEIFGDKMMIELYLSRYSPTLAKSMIQQGKATNSFLSLST